MLALSVSISTISSPRDTSSPSDLSHFRIVPSSMESERRGIATSAMCRNVQIGAPRPRSGTTFGTAPDHREVHELGVVAAAFAQQRRDPRDGAAVQRPVRATLLAGDVAGVVPGGEPVPARAVRDVEVAHEPDRLERVEVAV